jgi:glutamate synthase (NADPH/NADH) small chain
MEFLPQQNRRMAGDTTIPGKEISAAGKHVIVIGGGDTGSDCVGTALRQGAISVHQFELLACPPAERTASMPWPQWPMILRTSSSHEEGETSGRLKRDWAIATKNLEGKDGKLTHLHGVRLDWTMPSNGGRPESKEIPGTEFSMDADLILLAMGFLGPEPDGMLAQLDVKLDGRGNVDTAGGYQSSVPGVFAAGDMRRGQSLVVWAIAEGRQCAKAVDTWLMGSSDLT